MWYDQISLQHIVLMGAVSFAAALLAVYAGSILAARHRPAKGCDGHAEIAFLFDGEHLVDTSPTGRQVLNVAPSTGSDLSRIVGFFSAHFPSLSDAMTSHSSRAEVMSVCGTASVLVQRIGHKLRMRVQSDATADGQNPFVTTLFEELRMHRDLLATLPFPMWKQSKAGHIVWANAAYRTLHEAMRPDQSDTAPLSNIFADQIDFAGDSSRLQRAKLEVPTDRESRWFEFRMTWPDDDILLVTAVPIDRVVHAEKSLSGFVQTLTQTFAHLNVGLAVFNRTRELAIFNPALTELLGLSPEFLAMRPTLYQTFDRLREQRMVPEMKDYKSWRKKMSALEAAAADTDYSETWTLADGRTFRVTGRPHPEGAIAFMFEDISEEIALERKFRAELQMGYAVIDGLDEAIAVFAPSGTLLVANRAYRALWYGTPDDAAIATSFVEATRDWQHRCLPTPVWGDARDFAATIGERSSWCADVVADDGRVLSARFDTLTGGHTLVGFSEAAALPSDLHQVEATPRMSA